MLKMIFSGILRRTSELDCNQDIGLAPIAFSRPFLIENNIDSKKEFWSRECDIRPYQIACLNYDL